MDGSSLFLSPELSIETQWQLGVDIAMALDQCPPFPCSRAEAEQAMHRTHRWAHRNLDARREGQAVFGICQGGVHADLRAE
ncbi:tRNA-guanine transglycosylase, partial [Acinetobacter baumannii]